MFNLGPLFDKVPLKRVLISVSIVISLLVIYTQIKVFANNDKLEITQIHSSGELPSVPHAVAPTIQKPASEEVQVDDDTSVESTLNDSNEKEEDNQAAPADDDIQVVGNVNVIDNSDGKITEDSLPKPKEEEEEDIYEPEVKDDDEDDEESNKAIDVHSLPVFERLAKIYPYNTSSEHIEKNVIQSWKTTNVNELGKDGASWLSNEGFTHILFDDAKIETFLTEHFNDTVPEIISTYKAFPRNILRYDFFRYVATFALGGTYTDSDTLQAKPFTEWISYQKEVLGVPNTVGAVVGIEGECDCEAWTGIFTRRIQFCQWTIQAKKHHPLLGLLISTIIENVEINYNPNTKIFQHKDQKYDFSKGSQSYYDGILELTGPGAFTDAVFRYVNSLESPKIINPNDQDSTFVKLRHPHPKDKTWSKESPEVKNLGWEDITEIKDPVLVGGDVLVLPKVYFNGKLEEDEAVLVQHRYHGSWKSANNGV